MNVNPIEISIMGEESPLSATLERFQDPFHIRQIEWDAAWEELTRASAHGRTPDVSQLPATWIDDFVDLGALRSFTHKDIKDMGGASAFLEAVWKTVHMPWGKMVWAIPWIADVRVIYYWRDSLESAGIDEQTAFQTPELVEETLARLQANGVETPWIVWTNVPFMTLQNAASWVWNAGGDLVSADGKQVLFDQPEAIDGFGAYFRLHRYMPRDFHRLDHTQVIGRFIEQQAAVTMGPIGWLSIMRDRCAPDLVTEKLGVATPPSPAYVGGSNLVIWRYTRRARDAIALVRFLTDPQAQVDYCQRTGHLPVRLDALEQPPYTTDPHYQTMVEALRSGQTYPVFPKWGVIEEKLSDACLWFWDSIAADRDQDINALIKPYLESLARRLMVTLGVRR
jgi:multiple sugar transport system substrate-binding protein